jgi:pyridoxal phosphate-dependent aminotransferase EpsN
MPEAPGNRSTFWLTTLTIDPEAAGVDRETVRLHLESLDIEARPVWKPMHLQPVFADCEVYGGRVSQRLFDQGLCIPSGSSLSLDHREWVASEIRAVFGRS